MKKKLLIVTRGDAIGGVTEYVITIIRMLYEKFDVDIHITYSKEKVKNYYTDCFDDITFHNINMMRQINPIADFKTTINLIKLMKKEKFDVVHTNTSKGGIVGRIAAKIVKVPFIFHTVHGFAFHEQSSKISILIYSLFEKIGAHCCDYIITVSNFHKEWAKKLKIAPENKLIAIPNGLNIDRVKPTIDKEQIRRELKIENDEIAVFTIGRLAKQKGIEYLLKAIELLQSEEIDSKYHFYIAGCGELEKSLKNKVRDLNIDDKVDFLGFRRDVNNLLCAADIIVLPSLWEGLSIALLEAMAAKKAIICTDIGSNMTVVEDEKEALIVKCKDSVGIKENVKLLIENKEYRIKMADEAYDRFNLEFTKEIMLGKYFDFYKSKAKLYEN